MSDFPISAAVDMVMELNKTAGLGSLAKFFKRSPKLAQKATELGTGLKGKLSQLSSGRPKGMFHWEEPYLGELMHGQVPAFEAKTIADLGKDQIGMTLRGLEHSVRPEMSAVADLAVRNGISLREAADFYVRKKLPGHKKILDAVPQFRDLSEARVGADWLASKGFGTNTDTKHARKIYDQLMESGALHEADDILGDFPKITVMGAQARGVAGAAAPVALGAAGLYGLQKLFNKQKKQGVPNEQQ